MQNVDIQMLYPDAIAPTKGSAGATGWDVYAYLNEPELIEKQQPEPTNEIIAHGKGHVILSPLPIIIPLGFRMAVPEGWDCHLRSRSGLSLRGVRVSCGTIDPDYRGDMGIIMWDAGRGIRINHGDRVGQLVFTKLDPVVMTERPELPETDRGAGGFGSTGK